MSFSAADTPNKVNPLSANPTEWSNLLKQLFECVRPFLGIGA